MEPETPVGEIPVYVCASGLYFCDDFSEGTDQWNLLPIAGANGQFDILEDGGNNVLRYTAASSGAVGGILALVKPEAFAGVTSADYFVEARIRPRINSSGVAQRSIYVMARYQDPENWYGMGMIAHETNQPRVEIVKKSGSGNPASTGGMRYNTAIALGAAGGTDGEWYTLRLTMIGGEMTLYLNGEPVASYTDYDLTDSGLVGLFTNNRSFEIDDIKVGNANDVPVQLTLSPANSSYSAEVNDEPRVITVTARNSLGDTDTFTVESSDSSIVSVTVEGDEISLAPVGAGTAVITVTSGSDPNVLRTITATIAPEFVQPATVYDELDCLAFPIPGSSDVHVDTQLHLTFDAPPTLGSVGAIRIFNANDDSLVDTIKLEYEKDRIGTSGASRTLNTLPIQLVDNTVTIALHSDKLEYDTTYYVAISESVFPGASLSGQAFTGIGKASGWSFTTKAAAPAVDATSLSVGKNGATSDFGSVQGALNFVMENHARDTAVTINIQNGVYEELLHLRDKDNVTLRGESRDGVILQYRNSEKLNGGSDGRNVFLIANSDLVTLENLTLRNTTLIGEGAQAEALYFNSQGRLIAKQASFFSEQDTVQLKGYSWFYQTLIAGNVDYIWGNNRVALFEESEIRSIGRSSGINNGGIILQARTVNPEDKGFVFLNSELTRGAGPTGVEFDDGTVWLARSGGSATYYDNIVFVNTKMDTHVRPAGWSDNPVANPAVPSAISGWRQYNSMNLDGSALDVSGWTRGYTLTPTEYEEEFADRAKIFSAYDDGAGWNPQP